MSAPSRPSLIDRVQEHERQWGTENYPGRLSLAEILNAAVVAFWQTSKNGKPLEKPIITVHHNLDDIENWFMKSISRAYLETPDRRLLAVYRNGKAVRVKSVKVTFEVEDA
ncbi:MAG: hypothetical protein HND48_13335 [Chloroflexi bacterium]|nr:hypothetical protein [Chloroflexota bacterium]GIK28859.1 MAG: hypothetical protein BroJett007_19970 [Chloroflexota bacterium]